LLSETLRADFVKNNEAENSRLRQYHINARSAAEILPLEVAQKNKMQIDWENTEIAVPNLLGTKVFNDFPIEEIAKYIDWTPFFISWEMKGSYPKILKDPVRGVEAQKLFDDAQTMLKRIVDEKWIRANAVVGIFPANGVGDDIEVYDHDISKVIAKFHTLRQQTKKQDGNFNVALSDFIRPKVMVAESASSAGSSALNATGNKLGSSATATLQAENDYIGAFAVTTGIGMEKWIEQFEKDHDDYSSIMLKALADRLAEAFAELMHAKVRREIWGYASNESLSNEELIKEKYQGIRPAPGYPAQPDHTEKLTIWQLLDVEKNTGITLTEHLAMYPTSSVSGLYFANPGSHYFGLGKITPDQVASYAQRKGMALEDAERWLGPAIL
jgi:5-methyltetrahydrofolate--homocysteine methyltransferase